jgi:hypothetical protein
LAELEMQQAFGAGGAKGRQSRGFGLGFAAMNQADAQCGVSLGQCA